MAINFAAASTAGLNNPGTEIITLVKDGGGNFINPPSYDKILAYLRSGDVPCLFVTDAAGTTGDIYQLSGYSETENKIRFSNDANAIEFGAGCEAPVVSDVGGGGGFEYDFIIKSDYLNDVLETGTYDAIKAKVGNQPITGKIIRNAPENNVRKDVDCIFVNWDGVTLSVGGYAGKNNYVYYDINPDNTVTEK